MAKKKKTSKKNVKDFIVYPNIEFDVIDLLKELIQKDELKNKKL